MIYLNLFKTFFYILLVYLSVYKNLKGLHIGVNEHVRRCVVF